jgi:uncharacterized protein YndB with AHSA1/START domain
MAVTSTEAITASVEVGVDPETAFRIFTEEIDRWWRPGPINWYDGQRAIGTRIEPGVGGRWIEIYDESSDDVLEIGRVTAREPGRRLVMLYRDGGHALDGTEIEIRFDSIEGGSRVTLEHRGWERIDPDVATRSRYNKRSGWANILSWFQEWAFWGSPLRVGRPDVESTRYQPQ